VPSETAVLPSPVLGGRRARVITPRRGASPDAPARPPVPLAAWPVVAFAAALVWAVGDLTLTAGAQAVLAGALVAAASIDLEHRVLPNRIVLPAIPAVLALHAAGDLDALPGHLLAAFVTYAVLLVVAVASKGGLGMGDVKAGALMGAGLAGLVLPAFLVASLASAVVGVVLLAREGMAARKTTIPLGPFLALGTVAVLVGHGLS
jgi:leader peptidase (prepilin peptidase) / N-methyltransferase